MSARTAAELVISYVIFIFCAGGIVQNMGIMRKMIGAMYDAGPVANWHCLFTPATRSYISADYSPSLGVHTLLTHPTYSQ